MLSSLRKPAPSEVLKNTAVAGLQAVETILRERDASMAEVENQRRIIERLTMENESLRQANEIYQNQRDGWMQHSARVESHLTALFQAMNTLNHELRRGAATAQQQTGLPPIKQLAEKFAPEKPNEKPLA